MKNFLFTIALVASVMSASAQGSIVNDVFQQKEVFNAEGKSGSSLYVHTLEVLSDIAGSQTKSKYSVDVQDKEEGLVVYKGLLYLGFKKFNLLCGWDVFANFTLKVRCKDDKIQVAMIVPTITYRWTGDPFETTAEVTDVYPTFKYKGKVRIKKASLEIVPKLPNEVDKAVKALGKQLTTFERDDF